MFPYVIDIVEFFYTQYRFFRLHRFLVDFQYDIAFHHHSRKHRRVQIADLPMSRNTSVTQYGTAVTQFHHFFQLMRDEDQPESLLPQEL